MGKEDVQMFWKLFRNSFGLDCKRWKPTQIMQFPPVIAFRVTYDKVVLIWLCSYISLLYTHFGPFCQQNSTLSLPGGCFRMLVMGYLLKLDFKKFIFSTFTLAQFLFTWGIAKGLSLGSRRSCGNIDVFTCGVCHQVKERLHLTYSDRVPFFRTL